MDPLELMKVLRPFLFRILVSGSVTPEKNGSSAEKSLVRSGAADVHHGVLGEHALRQDDVEWEVNALFAELGFHSMQELP